jgi:hypothetical protein
MDAFRVRCRATIAAPLQEELFAGCGLPYTRPEGTSVHVQKWRLDQ